MGHSYGGATLGNSHATGSVTGTGSNVGGLAGKNESVVSNSYATGSVTGGSYVGGLVGYNYSGATVSDSYAAGSVMGTGSNIGGLVGRNGGTVSTSYATGSVSGNSYIGGLVGLSDTAVSNSYATGAVTGGSNAGGLAGGNFGTITNSYSTGAVGGTGNVGGLVGWNEMGPSYIINSFWDIQTSGMATSSDSLASSGLTTAQMMQLSSFSNAGWNIARTGGSGAVWRIYEGHSAPLLINFLTAMTIAAPDVTLTYNGTAQSGATIMPPDVSNFFGSAATGTNVGFYNGYYSSQRGFDITGGNLTITAAVLVTTSVTPPVTVPQQVITATHTTNADAGPVTINPDVLTGGVGGSGGTVLTMAGAPGATIGGTAETFGSSDLGVAPVPSEGNSSSDGTASGSSGSGDNGQGNNNEGNNAATKDEGNDKDSNQSTQNVKPEKC